MRPERGQLLSAGCGLALLVLMFAFAWYGVDGIPGGSPTQRAVWTENGWDGLHVVRWLILLAALAAIAAPVLTAIHPERRLRNRSGQVILGLGLLCSLLLVARVLIDLPSAPAVPDQKLGALLGLCSALGIALGGWDSLMARRVRLATRSRAR